MITGSVYLDLRFDPHGEKATVYDLDRDRRELHTLRYCPDGAEVVVDIGARRYVTQDAALWLNEHAHRLQITISGSDAAAVTRFVRAAREGDWQAVS